MKEPRLSGIVRLRHTFIMRNGVAPEVIILTPNVYKKIMSQVGHYAATIGLGPAMLLGMEIEIGDKVECRFRSRILTNKRGTTYEI